MTFDHCIATSHREHDNHRVSRLVLTLQSVHTAVLDFHCLPAHTTWSRVARKAGTIQRKPDENRENSPVVEKDLNTGKEGSADKHTNANQDPNAHLDTTANLDTNTGNAAPTNSTILSTKKGSSK
jgi:hypothetical protein